MATGKINKTTFLKQLRLILLSVAIALPIWCFTIVMFNKSWTLGGEKALLMWYEHLHNGQHENVWADSLLLIDMSTDKEIVTQYDEEDYKNCSNVSVNHSHLYKILRELYEAGNYRYIMLDIFLDKDVSQPADTALYQLIDSMPRIVIARSDSPLADSCLYAKSGLVQYSTTLWENDFVKFPFWTDNHRSMSLKMYEELARKDMKRDGMIMFDDGQYAQTSAILTYNVVWDDKLSNLLFHTDMLYEDSAITQVFPPEDIDGKYVLIGDFKNDMHNTFLGEMPGVLINFNAYVSLVKGYHRISFWYLLCLFIVFTLLVILTIHHSHFARVVMWFGYPVVLGALGLFTYVNFNQIYDVLSVTFMFYLLEKIIYIWDHRHHICKWIQTHYKSLMETKFMKRLISLKKALFTYLLLVMPTILYAGGNNPVAYRILHVNTPTIRIGHKILRKGDIFYDSDTIFWIKDNRHKMDVETVKAPHKKYILTHHEFKKYEKEGVKTIFDFIKIQHLGTRGVNARKEHYSEVDHYLTDTLQFSASTIFEPNIRCEAVWTKGKKKIITPINRTKDGKYYIITTDIYKDKKPCDIKLSIREIDDDLNWVNMVYQNIPIIYIPYQLGK